MKKRENNSTSASVLQITLSVALLTLSAILFASSFKAAPPQQQSGFYPALPVTPPLQQGDGVPGITVTLPTDSFNTSVPSSTVIIEPMTTSLIDPTTTNGSNYVGFQGDFTFDSSVVTFATPQVQRAGLTSDPNWNVSA